ncbi:MAG: rRNA adenine N(6)-methyltransferase family protein [Nocardioidaceae bacterium]
MSAGSGRPVRRHPSYWRSQPRSRRQWGWHCLGPEWAQRVVDASAVGAGDLVLDVGAGTGALTAPLVAAGARVVAVELNPERAASLKERFGDAVTVVRADLRDLRLPRRPFRVVASPPYSASADLLRLLMSTDRLLSADLVLQRAVARRLMAAPPSRRHTRRYVFELGMPVPRRAFSPPPQVDSVVLRVRRR